MVSRKTESAEMVGGNVSLLHGSAFWASPTELGMVATARGDGCTAVFREQLPQAVKCACVAPQRASSLIRPVDTPR